MVTLPDDRHPRRAARGHRLRVHEAQRFLVAGLAEEALAGTEHDGKDLQPQLVDEVMLHERAYELEAVGDDDFVV
jgi:hypothetical protein